MSTFLKFSNFQQYASKRLHLKNSCEDIFSMDTVECLNDLMFQSYRRNPGTAWEDCFSQVWISGHFSSSPVLLFTKSFYKLVTLLPSASVCVPLCSALYILDSLTHLETDSNEQHQAVLSDFFPPFFKKINPRDSRSEPNKWNDCIPPRT